MKDDNAKQRIISASNPLSEIDLMDLWNILVTQKVIFISILTSTFLVIFLSFLFNTATPIYKASAIVTPPTEFDLKGSGLYSPDLFKAFEEALRSRNIRMNYFIKNNLIEQVEINNGFEKEYLFEERFNKILSVSKHLDHKVISFESPDAQLATKVVNEFIAYANKSAVNQVLNQLKNQNVNSLHISEITGLIKNLEKNIKNTRNEAGVSLQKTKNSLLKEIESVRNNAYSERKVLITSLRKEIEYKLAEAKFEREARIIYLEEMALIADIIGIKDLVERYEPPHYMMGSLALRAEAKILRQRVSDEAFIKGIVKLKLKLKDLQASSVHELSEKAIKKLELKLKDLQSDSSYLKKATKSLEVELENLLSRREEIKNMPPLDFSNVTAMHFSQKAVVPIRANNRPLMKSVILTSVLSGLVLGILASFFANFISRARKKRDSSSHFAE